MKRTPFYRRPGRTGQFSGLRERVIWMIQTRGRPVTGSEIAEKFGVTLIEFNRVPFIGNGWLMPWGEVVSNPLKAQRLAEEYRERQEAA